MTAEATAADPITFSRNTSMNASEPSGRQLRYGRGKRRLGRWVTSVDGKVSKGREAALIHRSKIWLGEVVEKNRLMKTNDPLVCQQQGRTGGQHHEHLLGV
jgi:hypothetical protein